MTSIPEPAPGDRLFPDGSNKPRAVAEVTFVTLVYIGGAFGLIAWIHPSAYVLPMIGAEAFSSVSSLIDGAFAQVALIVCLALVFPTVRDAIRSSCSVGTLPAWGAAFIAAAIHVSTLVSFFIDQPHRIFESSWANIGLSAIPAIDGWSQEVLFRGYVIYRLARADLSVGIQISGSALLFAAIHIGYAQGNLVDGLFALGGTAVLGAFLAWSVLLARGALLPTITAHAAIIAIVQPWLALS